MISNRRNDYIAYSQICDQKNNLNNNSRLNQQYGPFNPRDNYDPYNPFGNCRPSIPIDQNEQFRQNDIDAQSQCSQEPNEQNDLNSNNQYRSDDRRKNIQCDMSCQSQYYHARQNPQAQYNPSQYQFNPNAQYNQYASQQPNAQYAQQAPYSQYTSAVPNPYIENNPNAQPAQTIDNNPNTYNNICDNCTLVLAMNDLKNRVGNMEHLLYTIEGMLQRV
ncbi:MAG: hypothetical protein FWG30_11960 [Eubacteriaceae bacterium]|nr:hypothetical protein [Eubacteriaceae bacterium]